MKPLTGMEIRNRWIKFFESKGHKNVPSVSLVPHGDKSLLWVNAGVTGLKKYFDGSEIPANRRMTNVQKCIRTNDIENVGHTARHHTFFEMLGNFSIGDYFRDEVIPWAFELLTDEEVGFGFPKEKLYITYNPMDKASLELWIKVGMIPDHMIPLEGNFWQIGEGPCGPDTEMFFDRGEKYDPEHRGVEMLKNDEENDRYIEIWNIVFSQFNAVNGVKREDYKELPSKNIDTGAGLERFACICQETPTNFETDLFMPIIEAVMKLSGKEYAEPNLMSFRVIADHIRCLTFALSDGAIFSNEGRGYVLRRIARRAMRYGQKLGINGPFLWNLVDIVVEKYAEWYPNLLEKKELVKKMILGEENKFSQTLMVGEKKLKKIVEEKGMISSEDAFLLYDTYGFPKDLTSEMGLELGAKVDLDNFDSLMEEQRRRAKEARGQIDSFKKQSKDLMAFKEKSEFRYDLEESNTKTLGLFKDGVRVSSLDEEGEVIFEETPFYAEMGGQVSDKGFVYGEGFEGEIVSVSKAPNGQHLHEIVMKYGTIKEGDKVSIVLDKRRRHLIERNHSATHLLHSALGNILGEHVDQRGSFVNEEYLRFDYSAPKKMSEEDLLALEKEVNTKIEEGIEEITEVLPIEEAKKKGAEMEFAEKYGDTVRVVEFGEYSKEFCGGTHVKNTSEIGLFLVKSDEAISSGVRRIEAITSVGAYDYLNNRLMLLDENEKRLGANDADLSRHIKGLLSDKEALRKENDQLKAKIAALEAKEMEKNVDSVNGIAFIKEIKEGASRDDLLTLADTLKANRKDYVLVLLGGKEGARPLVAMVGGEALKKTKAGDIVKEMAKRLGGGGGGRPEMATGQVKSSGGFVEAVESLKENF